MKLPLLCLESDFLNSSDWNEIYHNLVAVGNFSKNLEFFKTPMAQSLECIERDLKKLSFIMENFEEIKMALVDEFYYIKNNPLIDLLPEKLKKKSILDINELNYLCNMIDTAQKLKSLKSIHSIFFVSLNDFQKEAKVNKFKPFWRKFVNVEGVVSFDKHPIIAPLFLKLQKVEVEMKKIMKKLSQTSLYQNSLQNSEHDIINDHYVFALRADCYQINHGKIISQSKSGKTLFVSPFIVRDLYYQRLELMTHIEEEINKICREWSFYLHDFDHYFKILRETFFELDLTFIKASYCFKNNFKKPLISLDNSFEIVGIYHPLLKNPVRNNFHLEKNKRGLLISGPNTGGKSVFLKTLALSYCFFHMGMYLPVDSAKLPYFDKIYFFSTRQQGIFEGLSSFSSEVTHYLEVLKELSEKSLVFIDEIFNSTSSEEGSALAYSLFDEYLKIKNVRIFSSTHHQMLKFFCSQDERFESAHLGFSSIHHGPTYKIILGTPGSSMAFEVFEKLSKQLFSGSDIQNKAKKLLKTDLVKYDEVIHNLNKEHLTCLEIKEKLLIDEKEMLAEKKRMKGAYQVKLESEYQKKRLKIEQNLLRSQKFLKDLETGRIVTVKEYYHEKNELKLKISQFNGVKKNDRQMHSKEVFFIEQLDKGMNIFSMKVNQVGRIDEINLRKKRIRLMCGKLSIWHNLDELKLHQGSVLDIKKTEIMPHTDFKREALVQLEVDCRGMNLDEFGKILNYHLENLLLGSIPYLNIIHGHGGGVLKNWLRSEFLKNNEVFKWEADKSHDGSTLIKLL